ncbi:unnamed protein product, partial [Lymnaea stagnalis]
DDNSERSISPRIPSASASISWGSRSQYRAKTVPKEVVPEAYVIPRYDFTKVEEVKGLPDIDQVLAEIRGRDVVEEVINPVFTIKLVLTVTSQNTSLGDASAKKSKGSKVKWSIPGEQGDKSPDVYSGSESESDSEYETGDSEMDEEDAAQDKTDETQKYSYPARPKEESVSNRKSYVSLSPSAGEFRSSLQSIICYFEDTVVKIVPMMREPKLTVFYSPPKHDLKLKYDEEEAEEKQEMMNEWPNLDLILRDDSAYQKLLTEMLHYMDMQMELLERYTANYNNFCKMVDQSRKTHVEESIAKNPWTADEFNDVLGTHTEMVRLMNKMVTTQRVAMVLVEGEHFRDSCLPYPQAVVDAANKWLPIIANKHNDDLITIIKGSSKRLDKTIISVEEFVEHLSFLGRMSTELPALEKEYDVVNKMFTIAKTYKVYIQPEDMALYQTLSPSFQHLKSTILYCEAKKDDNIRKFSSQLDTLIGNIRSMLMNLKTRVQDPELLHVDTHPLSALEATRLLQEEVQVLSAKARSYASYQERFGSSLSKQRKSFYGELLGTDKKSDSSIQEIQTDLGEIERDLKLRALLWQSLEEWAKLVNEWTETSFESINVEALQKNVNKFTQTVYMLEKGGFESS